MTTWRTKKAFFCKEALFFCLLQWKKDQTRNEKELIAFRFAMSSRIDKSKDSTQTLFKMSFTCLIDACDASLICVSIYM